MVRRLQSSGENHFRFFREPVLLCTLPGGAGTLAAGSAVSGASGAPGPAAEIAAGVAAGLPRSRDAELPG